MASINKPAKQNKPANPAKPYGDHPTHDISAEAYRIYDFTDGETNRIYRIDNPVTLVIGKATHRVVDKDGMVHLCPTPGLRGCVVRWMPRNPAQPVQF